MTQIRPRAICSALAMPSGTQRLTPAPTPDTPKDIPDAPECSRDDPGVHFGCRWIQPAPKMMPKWMSESLIFMFCRKNNKKHKTIEISIENGLPGTRKSMKIQYKINLKPMRRKKNLKSCQRTMQNTLFSISICSVTFLHGSKRAPMTD